MKSNRSDRASPEKAQLLAEIDSLIARIAVMQQRCKGAEHGLVHLKQTHQHAIRLRQLVSEIPNDTDKLKRVAVNLAAIAKWVIEVYSLLSFNIHVRGFHARRKNYTVTAKGRRLIAAGAC